MDKQNYEISEYATLQHLNNALRDSTNELVIQSAEREISRRETPASEGEKLQFFTRASMNLQEENVEGCPYCKHRTLGDCGCCDGRILSKG
jgi:hypothetical protein